MTLPFDFTFSQSKLQDYLDCPRRFYLRHIKNLAWPALEIEPPLVMEKQVENGSRFHQMVHQFLIGFPSAIIRQHVQDEPILVKWWDNFERCALIKRLGKNRLVEHMLALTVADFRVVAVYDLIAWDTPDVITIIDWKTAQHRPKRRSMLARVQTGLYPYIVKRSFHHISGMSETQPEIVFTYWYSEFPTLPETISYTAQMDQSFDEQLHNLISKIASLDHDGFDMTENIRHCLYCRYRSYCNRGSTAGDLNAMDDIYQIPEYDPDPEQTLKDKSDA